MENSIQRGELSMTLLSKNSSSLTQAITASSSSIAPLFNIDSRWEKHNTNDQDLDNSRSLVVSLFSPSLIIFSFAIQSIIESK